MKIIDTVLPPPAEKAVAMSHEDKSMIKKKQNEKIGGIDYKNFLAPLGKSFTFVSFFSGAGIGD